jgi:hypothetical protein
MKPTISKPFKSNDRTFDKVYNAFDKRDYFNSQGLAKTQIGNFERALKKNDKGAQQVLDLFKGDEKKAKDYITQVISDRNKERAFNNYKALKSAVDSIQKGKPNVGAVDYVKRIIHNSSQKYSIALYSTLRNKKFTKWKDVHDDIDSLIGEGFKSDAQRKAAFANGYEEKGKKKNESVNEGKKRYYQQDRVGSAKYVISYHDGKKKHKDGSDFFDIQTFKNKKDLAKFVNTLHKGGYVYGFNESAEDAGRGVIPGAVKMKLQKAMDVLGGKKLNYMQKIKVLGKVIDSLGIDKKDLQRISQRIKSKLNESSKYRHLYYTNESKTKESKVIQKIYTYTKTEKKFYDELAKHEVRIGQKDYAKFILMALKGFGINPREFKRIPDAEEKLYQTVSK